MILITVVNTTSPQYTIAKSTLFPSLFLYPSIDIGHSILVLNSSTTCRISSSPKILPVPPLSDLRCSRSFLLWSEWKTGTPLLHIFSLVLVTNSNIFLKQESPFHPKSILFLHFLYKTLYLSSFVELLHSSPISNPDLPSTWPFKPLLRPTFVYRSFQVTIVTTDFVRSYSLCPPCQEYLDSTQEISWHRGTADRVPLLWRIWNLRDLFPDLFRDLFQVDLDLVSS